jgi:uncharacterized protein YjbJ (UPF0337 family)
MTMKSVLRHAGYRARETTGRVKQTVGRATGNDRLRHEGRTEELKSRLSRFATKVKAAVKR